MLLTPDEINEAHKRRWHEALVAAGLNANERTSYYKLDRAVVRDLDEQTRREFAAMRHGEQSDDVPQKRNANAVAFVNWMEANIGALGTIAELATEADVPQSAVRSVKETHAAWFRTLGGHIFQIVDGSRPDKNASPPAMSEAAAEVARVMAQLEGKD